MTSQNTDSRRTETGAKPFTTAQLDELAGRLRSALVSDILDGLGLREQCTAPGIEPLHSYPTLVGYAYPVVATLVEAVPEEPYVGLLDALDSISADDVWIMSTSGSDAGLWGELTSTAVRAQGARGSVIDGYVRDVRMVRTMGFPVFSRGTSPRDANGRVDISTHAGPVDIGGVAVSAADLVVADEDGVVIVPAALIGQVVEQALAKSADESLFRTAVVGGDKPSDAYRRYGVL